MKRRIPLLLLGGLCLVLSAYFGIRLYGQLREYQQGEKVYQSLEQYVSQPRQDTTQEQKLTRDVREADPTDGALPDNEPEETETDTIDWPEVDFQALREINPDIVAWICIPDTKVNYPVVLGDNNSYYLYRLADGTGNGSGSIFMDYRNAADFSDHNTVFYGHHMQNGSMFAQITNYKQQSFYEEHPRGLLMTPEGNYILEFFAGYVADLDSDAWQLSFGSDEEYETWLSDALERSCFRAGWEPTREDRVLTLSTCSYEYNDARFVLLATLRPAG